MNKINRGTMVATVVLLAGLAWGAWTMDATAAKADMEINAPQAVVDAIAGTIMVNTLDDESILDGYCSLREAIQAASWNIAIDGCGAGDAVSVDTITFAVEGTITVSEQLVIMSYGPMGSSGPLVIDGGNEITISGGNETRVIFVNPDSTLTLQRLTIANGSIEGEDGAGLYGSGAKITIQESRFVHNRLGESSRGGGFFCQDGILTVVDSLFEGNGSNGPDTYGGGGVVFRGKAEFVRTTFLNNETGGSHYRAWVCLFEDCWWEEISIPGGGGIVIEEAAVIIQESSFIDNMGGEGGGGIINNGETTILNSTIAINTAEGSYSDEGSGILNKGTLTILNSTLAENRSPHGNGSGIKNLSNAYIANSIIANNTPGDCAGGISDGGHNISSDDTCGFDIANSSWPNTDPLLGALQNNGGPTETYALLEGSPAIDAGSPDNYPLIDQRGMPRPKDGDGDGEAACDIGAFEYGKGIALYPMHQSSSGGSGTTLVYSLELYNFTDQVDSFSLALGSYAWQTSLSTDQTGPLDPGMSETLTVAVTIPLEAVWYQTDEVTITATSINNPGEYSTSAQLTTQAYAPPQISVDPQTLESNQVAGQSTTQLLTIRNGNGVTFDYTIYPPFSHPVMSLHMDEPVGASTFLDASEYSNDGTCSTIENCPTAGVSGIYGSAVHFDGVDDYIRVEDAPSLNPQNAITISAWILADYWDDNAMIVYKGTGIWGYYYQYKLEASFGYLKFAITTVGEVETTLPSTGEWHHVLGMYDGMRMQLWVDGVLQAQVYRSGVIPSMAEPLEIGAQYYDYYSITVDNFHGKIDEVHIFDRALSPCEIEYYYSLYYPPFHIDSELPWLSIDPISGSIPTNSSLPVQVTFDATGLQLGSYWTRIWIASNDPLVPVVVQVPVIMNVLPRYLYLPFISKADGD